MSEEQAGETGFEVYSMLVRNPDGWDALAVDTGTARMLEGLLQDFVDAPPVRRAAPVYRKFVLLGLHENIRAGLAEPDTASTAVADLVPIDQVFWPTLEIFCRGESRRLQTEAAHMTVPVDIGRVTNQALQLHVLSMIVRELQREEPHPLRWWRPHVTGD